MTPTQKPAETKHTLNRRLAPRTEGSGLVPTRIALVGAGGNGSQMVTCLARMDRALRSLGLPPLAVTLYDPAARWPRHCARRTSLSTTTVPAGRRICFGHCCAMRKSRTTDTGLAYATAAFGPSPCQLR